MIPPSPRSAAFTVRPRARRSPRSNFVRRFRQHGVLAVVGFPGVAFRLARRLPRLCRLPSARVVAGLSLCRAAGGRAPERARCRFRHRGRRPHAAPRPLADLLRPAGDGDHAERGDLHPALGSPAHHSAIARHRPGRSRRARRRRCRPSSRPAAVARATPSRSPAARHRSYQSPALQGHSARTPRRSGRGPQHRQRSRAAYPRIPAAGNRRPWPRRCAHHIGPPQDAAVGDRRC